MLDAVKGLPGQLSPTIAHDAIVHVPGNCANVRDAASLTARVVACLKDGSSPAEVEGNNGRANDT